MTQTEVDSERVFGILAAMLISFTSTIAEQLPPKSRKGRELTKLNDAIVRVAALHNMPLSAECVEIGCKVWGAAVAELQRQLTGTK
jgi:hypothetical protein